MTARQGKLVDIATAAELALPSTVATMTDDDWAAHDARIGAERSRQESADRDRCDANRRAALIAAGFPRRALDESAIADESKSAIARVKTWIAAPQGVLVLAGSKGCGKTVAATWWATRIASPAVFVRAATFAASSRYNRDERATWLGAAALVLDDLGMEFLDSKGSFLVDLDELIDVFYADYKPLLITTNSKADVFRERYGERIVDRIRECGSFFGIADASLRARKGPT
jgi:DNA replication protein DnaC